MENGFCFQSLMQQNGVGLVYASGGIDIIIVFRGAWLGTCMQMWGGCFSSLAVSSMHFSVYFLYY